LAGSGVYATIAPELTSAMAVAWLAALPPLSMDDFGNFWWYGVGVTDQYGYHSLDGATNDYTVAYWNDNHISANQLMNIGSIQNDPGDYPYDEYETTWIRACPGSCP
jgi:hypothetical protein